MHSTGKMILAVTTFDYYPYVKQKEYMAFLVAQSATTVCNMFFFFVFFILVPDNNGHQRSNVLKAQ